MTRDKRKLIELLIQRLQQEMDGLTRAALAAHQEATHQEAKPENQYDTRGLEASYLAGAQAQRVAEIGALIASYRTMSTTPVGASDPIGPGAWVEVALGQRRSHFFLVPRGGGISVECDGVTVQAIACGSPMGEALLGRKAGDWIEIETKDSVREYQIVSVH